MKQLLFMLSCLMLSSTAIAQTELGFKIGIGASRIVLAGEPDGYDHVLLSPEFIKVAYQVGGYGTVAMSNRLNLRTEILLNNKGIKKDDLYYLSLPLLLQYKILNNLNVEAGPEFAYLLPPGSNIFSYNPFDLGINLGANFSLTQKVMLGARYSVGIVDMAKGGTQVVNRHGMLVDASTQNRALQFSLSYSLLQ